MQQLIDDTPRHGLDGSFLFRGQTSHFAAYTVDLGLAKIRLLTNNPSKRAGIQGFGLEVVERIPLQVSPTPRTKRYLRTKQEKLGHLLDLASEDPSPVSGEAESTRRRNGP